MSNVPELAKRFIPFSYMQKAAAIISIGTVMMKCRVSADKAASNSYDVMRGEIMMQNGIDGADVQRLLETDFQVLLNPTVTTLVVNASLEERAQLMLAIDHVKKATGLNDEQVMNSAEHDAARYEFLCEQYEVESDRAVLLTMVSLEWLTTPVSNEESENLEVGDQVKLNYKRHQ